MSTDDRPNKSTDRQTPDGATQTTADSEPRTSIDALSFAAPDVGAVEAWASQLPLVNIEETTQQLAMALAEVTILDARPELRFTLIETLRPLVHYIYTRADRSARGQRPTGQAAPAHVLQSNLCRAYEYVFREVLEQPTNMRERELLPKTAHRLLAEMSLMGLRSLQHYAPLPPHYWRQINETYAQIEALELTSFTIPDQENATRSLSIEEVYLRILLLASCKPNQLVLNDLANVYNALQDWCQHAHLSLETNNALFVVDLDSNKGPQLAKFANASKNRRTIHTEVLAYEIDAYINDVTNNVIIPDYVNPPLLSHLASAWSVIRTRNFNRLTTEGSVRICVGMAAAHYFLSGGTEFEAQISNADELLRREINPFLQVQYESPATNGPDDPWSYAHDLKVKIPENPNIQNPDAILSRSAKDAATPGEPRYLNYETQAINTSPGGYCVNWREALPVNAKVGELVAIRDETDPRWRVALIRWISREGSDAKPSTNMGLELLSPRAIPLAARVIQKRGSTANYARVLLLPGLEMINQPATLITPHMPFAAKQKINLQRQDIQATGLLLESQLKTGSFNQFTFRMLDGYLESSASGRNIDTLSAMTREDTTQGP